MLPSWSSPPGAIADEMGCNAGTSLFHGWCQSSRKPTFHLIVEVDVKAVARLDSNSKRVNKLPLSLSSVVTRPSRCYVVQETIICEAVAAS